MVNRPGRFQRAGKPGLAEPDSATRYDENHTSGLGVPFGLPATRRMLEVAGFFHRTEAELIIKSRRAAPGRLLEAGFQFRFPRMEDAVREIEGRLGLG